MVTLTVVDVYTSYVKSANYTWTRISQTQALMLAGAATCGQFFQTKMCIINMAIIFGGLFQQNGACGGCRVFK